MTKKEIDIITIPDGSLTLVHEPKTKVDLTKYLEHHKFKYIIMVVYTGSICSTVLVVYTSSICITCNIVLVTVVVMILLVIHTGSICGTLLVTVVVMIVLLLIY